MNKFKVCSSVLLLTFTFVVGLSRSATAATTPGLGQAASFGILANTYTNTVSGTTINGDLGYTTGPATAPTVNGSVYSPPSSTYSQAGVDQGTALTNLNAQACTSIGAAVTLDTHDVDGGGPLAPGTYPPGCYSSTGAMGITASATVTLTGAGTYIFRPDGALTTGANSIVSLVSGAAVCDVFWTPTAATTLGANSTFVGTDIDAAGITIGSTVTWAGRALAFGGTVSTDSDTVTVPTCSTTTAETETETTSTSSATTGVPGLPNTGLAATDNSIAIWKVVTPVLVILAVPALYFCRKKWA